ncbi:MAG: hypothetical protein ABIT47_02495 [Candidatus Paceibacterota bacterium]
MSSVGKVYVVSENFSIIQDSPQHIDMHIRSGDYFLFLATMVGIMEELLEKCEQGELTGAGKKYARELRHDLRYVQANYKILPRELHEIEIVRPSGNLLLK